MTAPGTASGPIRTVMLPKGSPPRDHDHENRWPGRRYPRRANSRTSIDRQLSQVKRRTGEAAGGQPRRNPVVHPMVHRTFRAVPPL